MKQLFEAALTRVLAHEGGYTHHPSDPGGPTNWGITLHDARRYWKADASAADVRAMPPDVAAKIYRSHYWDAMRADDLPPGVDYVLFDYGVNSGVGRARRVARRIAGLVGDADRFSDSDIRALCEMDPHGLVTAICAERRRFLRGLKTWPIFGKGWARRVADVEANALAMINDAAISNAASTTATSSSWRLSASRTVATGTAAAVGVGIAGMEWSRSTILIAMALIAALAIAGWLAWRWLRRRADRKGTI